MHKTGSVHQLSCPHTPQKNNIAEHKIDIIRSYKQTFNSQKDS